MPVPLISVACFDFARRVERVLVGEDLGRGCRRGLLDRGQQRRVNTQVEADAALAPDKEVSPPGSAPGQLLTALQPDRWSGGDDTRLDQRNRQRPGYRRRSSAREGHRARRDGDQRAGQAGQPDERRPCHERDQQSGVSRHEGEADQPDPADRGQRENGGVLPLTSPEDGPRAADSLP
jgi:hypothetical protein